MMMVPRLIVMVQRLILAKAAVALAAPVLALVKQDEGEVEAKEDKTVEKVKKAEGRGTRRDQGERGRGRDRGG